MDGLNQRLLLSSVPWVPTFVGMTAGGCGPRCPAPHAAPPL